MTDEPGAGRPARKQFGAQNLVEFAILGPVFFLILFGVIEGGRLVWTNHEVANGTREGARYVMVHGEKSGDPVSDADVQDYVLDHVTGLDSADLNVDVSYPDGGSTEPGKRAEVTATYTYRPIVGMVFGTSPWTLSSTSTVIIEH